MKKLYKTKLAKACILALTAPCVSFPAYADLVLEEIVVTARKRAETIQDAPLAVSAFGQLELEQGGFDSILDISKATPGLFIEKFNSGVNNNARVNTTPRFRGIFLDTGDRLRQTATVFLDGVAISGGIQSIGVNELQLIEITKGPQSALYGRNTFSGAINYITKDPGDEFAGEAELTVASRGEYRLAAGIEGPISSNVKYRIGVRADDIEGHHDNFAVPGETLGDESQWNINGTLYFEPSEDLTIKTRLSYRELDDGASAITGGAFGPATHNFGGFILDASCTANRADSVIPSSNSQCVPGVGGRSNSIFRGTITGDGIPLNEIGINTGIERIENWRQVISSDPRFNASANAFANDFTFSPFEKDDFGLDLEETRLSLKLDYDINDDMTFTLLSGYSEESYGLFAELDQTPDDSFTTYVANEIEDFSIETRLQGSSGKFNWAVGASYVDVEIASLGGTISNLFFPIAFGDSFRATPRVTGAETVGVFASVDYSFTDQFSLTLEGRHQKDTIIDETVNENVPGLSPAEITNFLPRATLRWQPSDDTTVYATYSEGNLPGGFNPEVAELDQAALDDVLSRSPGAANTFGEEKLENYELGWKQTLWDGRASFNLAAFYMERSDEIFQAIETAPDNRPGAANPRRTVIFSSNGATTDIYGFELDFSVAAAESLTLGGSLAYIDAEVSSFPDGGGTDRFGLVFGPNVNPAGQEAPKFPSLTASMNATYEKDVKTLGFDQFFFRGDFFYTGEYYTSNANLTEVDSAFDVNLRTGLRNERFDIELFVTNLFDENTPASAQTFADTSFDVRLAPGGFFNFNGIGNRLGLRDKRQVGVRAKYNF